MQEFLWKGRLQIWRWMFVLSQSWREKKTHWSTSQPSRRSYSSTNAWKVEELQAKESYFQRWAKWRSTPELWSTILPTNLECYANDHYQQPYWHHGPRRLQSKQVPYPSANACSSWHVPKLWIGTTSHAPSANASLWQPFPFQRTCFRT